MNQANGKIERAFNIQKRTAITTIGVLQQNYTNLTDLEIQQVLYDLSNILRPQMDMPWVPKTFWQLYIFMLNAIDPKEYINTLKSKTNFQKNYKPVHIILKQIKTNLLQTKGETQNGLFNGIVHKHDINPEVYKIYFPKSTQVIYTDMVCRLSNGEYTDLDARDERIKNKLWLMNTINYRSKSFAVSLNAQKTKYNAIKNMDWQPIWDKCNSWKPLPYNQYLNQWQLCNIPKEKLK